MLSGTKVGLHEFLKVGSAILSIPLAVVITENLKPSTASYIVSNYMYFPNNLSGME
jgi:hypothetical protein